MKVLFSGTNVGEVYACEEMIDGATVINYVGNDQYWANDHDTAEQNQLSQEIFEHLRSLNIQPEFEAEEVSQVEPSAVFEWEDGLVVRATPGIQQDLDEFEFGGTEEFEEEVSILEVEQGLAMSFNAGGEE